MSAADEPVVIVGAGQAGHQVASSLRLEGYTGPVTLLGNETGLPYQRPPLSKEYLLEKDGTVDVDLADHDHYRANDIDVRSGEHVTAIDRHGHTVRTATGTVLPYRWLVLATGVRARRIPVAGHDLGNVFTLATRADAGRVREQLHQARRAVVIGGGFIGLEFATVAARLGVQVTVVEAADAIMKRALSAPTAQVLVELHEANGIDIRVSSSVVELAGRDGAVSAVRLATGEVVEADLVVLGVGVAPNTELAADAGLAVDNGVVVDEFLRTEDPTVFAIGDCARYPSALTGQSVRLESVQNAVDQARSVAATLTGSPAPYRAVPWFWSLQAGHRLQIAGLCAGYDSTVRRDGDSRDSFSMFCFRGDTLLAVESVSRPADHMSARRILAAGGQLTPAQAADTAFDLKRHSLSPSPL